MLSELCVRRPVFATMLVLSLVVLGAFSFRDLGVDLFPRADPATVTVSVQLPGASPSEMSTSVVEPLEQALSSIAGIDEMQSRINEGTAQITVKFVLERDINDATSDVREKVGSALKTVPPQLLPPIIQKVDPDSDPVLSLALSSKTMSLRTLSEIADKQVKRALQSVDGVGEVDLSGTRAREVHVVVDIEKLNSYQLSIDQVRDAVDRENIETPGGSIEQGKSQLLLRTRGRIDSAAKFNNIVIATRDGTAIRVSDVGYAEDSVERPTSAMWMDDGAPAVMVDVRRATGENTIRVIEGVKRQLELLRRTLPRGVDVVLTKDDSQFIYASIASLEEHLLWGSLLAAAVVMFFIRNIRAVIISSLAIPASIIATFTLMRAMDFTLNSMTLLGLTLAVGIVIDDAIVVLENIFRYVEERHVVPFEAAIAGTREVTLAVMATTLSLVVIFLPVAFMTGYTRRFVNPFGWTMTFSILVSMIVSFTLTPMLSSRFLRASDAARDDRTKNSRLFRTIDAGYTRAVRWSLAHSWVIIGAAAVALAALYPLNAMVGRSFIPNEDMGEFTIHVDAPEGTALDGMAEQVRNLASEMRGIEGIAHIEILAGAGRLNHGHLFIKLLPLEERTITQDQVIGRVRHVLAGHPSYKPSITMRTALGGGEQGNFPIQANLRGPDMGQLVAYSMRLLADAQRTPTLADPKVSVNISNPEVHVDIDRQRAADLGVRMSTIGSALRLMVAGDDIVSYYREGTEQYPVKLRVLESQRRDIDAIAKLTVPSASGLARIDNLGTIERGLGPSMLQRFNHQFSIQLSSDVAAGHALDEASSDVRRLIGALNMSPEYSVKLTGQTKLLEETTTNLIMAIALAGVFVYMVLAAQFESFMQPIIIMLVLPLSVPFALFTLWITGRTLNLWSALGVLLLLGIVKKNSILQVDYANVLRARGVPLHDAVIEASRTRLRPILMTTAAIVAGLVPTALGIGIGGAQRSAIAVTIIGGQSLCLLLTLLLVPVAYVKFDAFEQSVANQWLKVRTKRLRQMHDEPAPTP
jgi:hydrophobic/amphiphilic exporter-1 (mainly G- bacteria), HAE1 family